MEGLVDDPGEVGRILHEIVVLGAVPGEADRVGFLEGVGADEMRRDLAGNDDHGDGVHERVANAGDRIGRAGAGRDEHDAGLPGRTGIAFRGMRCGLARGAPGCA